MTRIAHVSDLHFGRVDAAVVNAAVDAIRDFAPDVVVVSGDLTQRAVGRQFRAARAFIDRLPGKHVVVPGNHDIPFYNVVWRFLFPMRRFVEHFGADLEPFVRENGVAVLGINTARRWSWKNGRISADQITRIREVMCPLPSDTFKIVVTHHPFLRPSQAYRGAVVGRAEEALRALDACHVDMVLAGHLHVTHAGEGEARVQRLEGHTTLVVQSGTATSNRMRGERNSFNAITIGREEVTVDVRGFERGAFVTTAVARYVRTDGHWKLGVRTG